jgi:hypothetical protein
MRAGSNLTPCVGTSSARPDLGSVIDKDRPDYTVYCDAAASMKLAEALRWFWSMTVNGPMTRADRVATLEEAKARFQKELGCLEGLGEPGRDRLGQRRAGGRMLF